MNKKVKYKINKMEFARAYIIDEELAGAWKELTGDNSLVARKMAAMAKFGVMFEEVEYEQE